MVWFGISPNHPTHICEISLTWVFNSCLSFCLLFVSHTVLSCDCVNASMWACKCAYVYAVSLVAQMVKNLLAMQETWLWSLCQEDPLEKETATQFSILAWQIPWTGEPGRLQSMGLQRIGHDWELCTYVYTCGLCLFMDPRMIFF